MKSIIITIALLVSALAIVLNYEKPCLTTVNETYNNWLGCEYCKVEINGKTVVFQNYPMEYELGETITVKLDLFGRPLYTKK